MILENSLANYSFLTLLGSMIFYWIEASFAGLKFKINIPLLGKVDSQSTDTMIKGFGSLSALQEKPWRSKGQSDGILEPLQDFNFQTTFASEKDSNKISWFEIVTDQNSTDQKSVAKYGIVLSNFLLTLLLLFRWKESGHFPLSNLYESLMFLSWCFTALHLYIENETFFSFATPRMQNDNNQLVTISQSPRTSIEARKETIKLLGAITTPSALLTNAFATLTLPKEMQEATSLVPALQSNWLMMHVTVMILSYAALILGSLMSIAFLIVTSRGSIFPTERDKEGQQDSPIAFILDNLSYRILGIGFPLLTIGILSGAVWANEAWGSYWSWDPKETWALLTWLIFAIYLHTRLSKGWEGKKPAIIASFGFVTVWICYLGVNLIGEGLHSYGWIV